MPPHMATLPSKAGLPAPELCSDCAVAKACIRCCDASFCLLHAHCTKHAQHPAMWKITDKAAYTASLAAVSKLRDNVISELEAELQGAEALLQVLTNGQTAGDKSQIVPPQQIGSSMLPAPKPSLPAPQAIRRRASNEISRSRYASTQADSDEDVEHASADRSAFVRQGSNPELLFHVGKRSKISGPTFVTHVPQREPSAAPAPSATSPKHYTSEDIRNLEEAFSPDQSGRAAKILFRALSAGCAADAALATASRSAHDDFLTAAVAFEHTLAVAVKPSTLKTLADAIESAVRDHSAGSSESYSSAIQRLYHVLKSPENISMREKILGGDVTYVALASMSTEELESKSAQETRERLRAAAQAPTDVGMWLPCDVACPDCRSSNTKYMPLSSMRDIRKAEIWGSSSTEETTRFRFRCENCANVWDRETL